MVSMATRWRSWKRDPERQYSLKSRGPPPHQLPAVAFRQPAIKVWGNSKQSGGTEWGKKYNVGASRCFKLREFSFLLVCLVPAKRPGLDSEARRLLHTHAHRHTHAHAQTPAFNFIDTDSCFVWPLLICSLCCYWGRKEKKKIGGGSALLFPLRD